MLLGLPPICLTAIGVVSQTRNTKEGRSLHFQPPAFLFKESASLLPSLWKQLISFINHVRWSKKIIQLQVTI